MDGHQHDTEAKEKLQLQELLFTSPNLNRPKNRLLSEVVHLHLLLWYANYRYVFLKGKTGMDWFTRVEELKTKTPIN